MNEIELKRRIFTDKSTIGDLLIAGVKVCDVLEDTCRAKGVKVYGQTAIPEGRFPVVINWSERFQRLMPRLLDVTGFQGVLIHNGNSPKDTLACLLVGRYSPETPDWVSESKATFEAVYDKLKRLSEFGPMTITVEGGRPMISPGFI